MISDDTAEDVLPEEVIVPINLKEVSSKYLLPKRFLHNGTLDGALRFFW